MPYRGVFSDVFVLEVVVAGIVFGIAFVTLVVALLRRRAKPSRVHERPWLEGAYVVILVLIATTLAVISITMNDREHTTSGSPSLTVVVTGYQWCWRFYYPKQSISVIGSCEGKAGPPSLVLPTNRLIRIEVTSSDVVHEFWLPYLRYKVEALPDHVNSFTVTLATTGRWVGRCSEYCGLYHSFMDFYLRAVTPAEFTKWTDSHLTTAGVQ